MSFVHRGPFADVPVLLGEYGLDIALDHGASKTGTSNPDGVALRSRFASGRGDLNSLCMQGFASPGSTPLTKHHVASDQIGGAQDVAAASLTAPIAS